MLGRCASVPSYKRTGGSRERRASEQTEDNSAGPMRAPARVTPHGESSQLVEIESDRQKPQADPEASGAEPTADALRCRRVCRGGGSADGKQETASAGGKSSRQRRWWCWPCCCRGQTGDGQRQDKHETATTSTHIRSSNRGMGGPVRNGHPALRAETRAAKFLEGVPIRDDGRSAGQTRPTACRASGRLIRRRRTSTRRAVVSCVAADHYVS